MRIVAFADTHGQHRRIKVPDGDILIFAGDMCMTGETNEALIFAGWFNALPHKSKIYVAGNHDWPFTHPESRCVDEFRATYLQDEEVIIDGIKIWGAPWTPTFFDWAFMKERGNEIRERWGRIPDDADVLVTHGPPRTMLDRTTRERAGCDELRMAVERVKPKLHVFGHIHESYGKDDNKDTVFANVSMLDGKYDMSNREPMVFEV